MMVSWETKHFQRLETMISDGAPESVGTTSKGDWEWGAV